MSLSSAFGVDRPAALSETSLENSEDVFVFPASFAQERLWFLDQFDPGSTAYIIPGAYYFSGPVNTVALEQSINEIVRRHEVLRTTFTVMNGQVVQVVAPTLTVTLQRVDLRKMSEGARRNEIERLAWQEASRPFDLTTGPLLRALLVQLSDSDQLLLLTMHHIISDAWSCDIFFRELTVLYNSYAVGRPSPLPELSFQYADFAQWQRQLLEGEVLEKHLDYWRQHLRGASAVLDLPSDRPRPSVQTFRGATLAFEIPNLISGNLKALSQGEGTTLFMTLMAAFMTLLYRYTGQDDIVVGTPVANRARAEIEELIGFFINTLVLRTSFSGNPSFRQLLRQVREVTLGAYAHQDLPFEKLVQELQPARHVSYNPLFQVMFAYQNAPFAVSSPAYRTASGEMATFPQISAGTAKFDLTLFVSEVERRLVGAVEYNIDLFDAARIIRLIGHFRTLLEGIAGDPDRRISDLPLLSSQELDQLLEWNATHEMYAPVTCIHTLFEAQVERSPETPAVIFEEQLLTYRELNRRANQLGHFLRKLGVGPETRVGICLERSPDMAVALLAILKAGGAYVPLDPAYPQERLGFMISDAGVPVLLTNELLQEVLPSSGAIVVCLDRDAPMLTGESHDNPSSGALPDNLAYVIYTSGSTGAPKGVAMAHRPLFNLLSWQIASSDLPIGARTLQYPSLSFDVSFQEILSTWCAGGALVITSDETRRDAGRLAQCLADMAIARIFIPPVVLQQLADTFTSERDVPHTLRQIIVAGEQLQITTSIADFCSRFQHAPLQNHYGPTETHLVTHFTLVGSRGQWMALPPIGRPIANLQTHVLSPCLQPLPIGVLGELYIGGDGLGRGYLNRPELTAEKFVPDPFSSKPGARLYKSGDLVRYLPDGNLEFFGRIDHQVKIRGFRIEPGEVETALQRYPAIRDCVVAAQKDNLDGAKLVAYVLPHQGLVPTTTELRRFLKTKLPEYMLPSAFVLVAAFPLTPNGKVDRQALPAADIARPALEEAFLAPRNPTEAILADIWADVLRLERVGIHDNFFDLGGHSLLATQLISRVRDRMQIELPLRQLFEAPTVAELAAITDQLASERQLQHVQAIERIGHDQADQLLAKLDQLSDKEVEALLREL
jgi:amino acid adenylation domain-containing protein